MDRTVKTGEKKSFRNYIRLSNSWDLDQDRHTVSLDLGPNCLQSLSVEDKSPLARSDTTELIDNQKLSHFNKPILHASSIMEKFDIRVERPKPNPVDEVIRILKRVLQYCLCCITCGCVPAPDESSRRSSTYTGEPDYSSVLLDNEKEAVQNLLQYLENGETKSPVLTEEHIRALKILTFSDNIDLQTSAALCYSEVSEKMKVPLTEEVATPLVTLLKSHDPEIQKASTLAISNFAISGPELNKTILIDCGVLPLLVKLLHSKVVEVQCNACGCITTLANTDATKRLIVTEECIPPLLDHVISSDLRVRRNAAGAILNLTHLQTNRNDLVTQGAIPVLIEALQADDHDIQYYCSAALSNIAINDKHRAMMVAVGCHDIIELMIRLLSSKSERVKCQACYALRNLASDVDSQSLIVQFGCLPVLHKTIVSSHRETRSAAMACLRNLSVHKANEAPILSSELLADICSVLKDQSCPEAQRHAAGTLRNLTVGDHVKELLEHGCLECLVTVLLDIDSKMAVLAEVTAALAVMADDDGVKYKLVQLHDGKVFVKLVTLATLSTNTEVQYNSAGTLGQLALIAIPDNLKTQTLQGIVLYIDKFLKSEDANFIHISLWTLVQLLKDNMFLEAFRDHGIDHVIAKLTTTNQPPTIQELADTVSRRLKGEPDSTSSSD